ncbi:hypothetical protein LLG96_03685 [bacterium]|nr:hypothetical protein [bacterium]
METTESHQQENLPRETFRERLSERMESAVRTRIFAYLFMISLLVYVLLSGYVLTFSGSLFLEAVYKGWWRPDATEFETTSLLLGYLFGFPSLLGLIGGITVLSTRVQRMFRFKVLFFIPSVVWTILLVLDIVRRPMQDWYHWLYLIPAMLLSIFVLFSVVKKVRLPYLT